MCVYVKGDVDVAMTEGKRKIMELRGLKSFFLYLLSTFIKGFEQAFFFFFFFFFFWGGGGGGGGGEDFSRHLGFFSLFLSIWKISHTEAK